MILFKKVKKESKVKVEEEGGEETVAIEEIVETMVTVEEADKDEIKIKDMKGETSLILKMVAKRKFNLKIHGSNSSKKITHQMDQMKEEVIAVEELLEEEAVGVIKTKDLENLIEKKKIRITLQKNLI
jgi:hypothetical protein